MCHPHVQASPASDVYANIHTDVHAYQYVLSATSADDNQHVLPTAASAAEHIDILDHDMAGTSSSPAIADYNLVLVDARV